MFGTYGGGQIYSFLAMARTIGAFIPFAILGFIGNAIKEDEEGNIEYKIQLPELEKTFSYFYVSLSCLVVAWVGIIQLNPTALVK
jgi:hypothetical protein